MMSRDILSDRIAILPRDITSRCRKVISQIVHYIRYVSSEALNSYAELYLKDIVKRDSRYDDKK